MKPPNFLWSSDYTYLSKNKQDFVQAQCFFFFFVLEQKQVLILFLCLVIN